MTIDGNDPLLSLQHRRELVAAATAAERLAQAQRQRVLARILVAGEVEAAERKLTLAEDSTDAEGHGSRETAVGLGRKASSATVELAQAQLKHLVDEDGPTFIRHADEVAAAIEARGDGGKVTAPRRGGKVERRESLVKEEGSP